MAKAKAPQKKKAQEKKVAPPPPAESFSSSELDEEEAERSQPLANSTTRGTPAALNKTAEINKIPNLAEEDSEDTEEETGESEFEVETSESESEEEQPELDVPNGFNPKKRKARQSKSKKAGLIFPVSRVHRQLKERGYADRIAQSNINSRFRIKIFYLFLIFRWFCLLGWSIGILSR